MPIDFEALEGATPLIIKELEQRRPLHITSMAKLNASEQMNIAKADIWTFSRNRKGSLEIKFAHTLHKRMFGGVWLWGWWFRQRNANN